MKLRKRPDEFDQGYRTPGNATAAGLKMEKRIFYLLDSERNKTIPVEGMRESVAYQWKSLCANPKHLNAARTLLIYEKLGTFHCYKCGWEGKLSNLNKSKQPETENKTTPVDQPNSVVEGEPVIQETVINQAESEPSIQEDPQPATEPHFQSEGEEFELWNFELKEKQTVVAGKKGKDLFALCPWHADTRPSLQIYPDEKRYHCHGCKVSGKFYDPKFEAGAREKENREIESTFDYHNEKGELVFQVVRFKPKNFSVRRPNPNFQKGDDENEQWIWGKGDIKVIPYHLPEIISSEGPIYIVEGETKADALKEMGLTATCNPFGAGKWKAEYNEFLKDREIVILCDNDDPGRKHGSDIASSNSKTAKSIKMPVLPGLREKGDIIDYQKAGGTRESFLEIVEQTPLYNPVEDQNKLHYKITTIDEILNYPDPVYLIDRILTKDTLNILDAYAGAGKSIIALSIAKAMMTGGLLWGKFRVLEKGVCLLVDEETPKAFLKDRVSRLRFDRSLPFPVCHFQNVRIDSDSGMEALEEVIDTVKPTLLIIDSFVRIHNLSENKVEDMSMLTERLRKIVNQGTTIILIHHFSKGKDRPDEERARGSSEIVGGIDTEFSITKKSESDGEKIVEFKSQKTRVAPVDPILLKMSFPKDKNEEIRVMYQGTKEEDAIKGVIDILKEEEINGFPLKEGNGATVAQVKEWIKERDLKIGEKTLRKALKSDGIMGEKDRLSKGQPIVYWPAEARAKKDVPDWVRKNDD